MSKYRILVCFLIYSLVDKIQFSSALSRLFPHPRNQDPNSKKRGSEAFPSLFSPILAEKRKMYSLRNFNTILICSLLLWSWSRNAILITSSHHHKFHLHHRQNDTSSGVSAPISVSSWPLWTETHCTLISAKKETSRFTRIAAQRRSTLWGELVTYFSASNDDDGDHGIAGPKSYTLYTVFTATGTLWLQRDSTKPSRSENSGTAVNNQERERLLTVSPSSTRAWLSTFMAQWHPSLEIFVCGSMAKPRRMEIFDDQGKAIRVLQGEALGSAASRCCFHPSEEKIIDVGGNSSGRVTVAR